MRPPEPLSAFVREALAASRGREEIAAALHAAGWSGPEVRAGLAAWGDAPALPPVPRPGASLSAGDALRHAVLFLALGIVAVNLGGVLFALVDLWFPDPLAASSSAAGVRRSIAGLTVAWPVWAWLSLALERRAEADPGRRRSAVGRWLTALALFVAAATVLGDLIAVVAGFLGGDLTPRFLAKAAVVAAIAGGVFAVYGPALAEEEAA
jgi:membrane protein YqaA with SNARE-associated domain